MGPEPSVAAIVLTGGASSRMGRHKPGLDVGGRPIVARELEALAGLPVVVVGSAEGVPEGVRVVREAPPGGGPVAGIAAGLADLKTWSYAAGLGPDGPDVVVVVAGDLPLLTRAHVDALVTTVREGLERPDRGRDRGPDREAGTVAVTEGRSGVNWLCAAWPTAMLDRRLAALGDPTGASVRRLLGAVRVARVADPGDVAVDVDTPADLAAVRSRSEADPAS